VHCYLLKPKSVPQRRQIGCHLKLGPGEKGRSLSVSSRSLVHSLGGKIVSQYSVILPVTTTEITMGLMIELMRLRFNMRLHMIDRNGGTTVTRVNVIIDDRPSLGVPEAVSVVWRMVPAATPCLCLLRGVGHPHRGVGGVVVGQPAGGAELGDGGRGVVPPYTTPFMRLAVVRREDDIVPVPPLPPIAPGRGVEAPAPSPAPQGALDQG